MLRTVVVVSLALSFAACASTMEDRPDAVPSPVTAEAPTSEAPPARASSDAVAPAPVASNLNLADIPFAPFNPEQPEGIHVFAITGDFKTGPFTAIARFPAGYRSPLHTHTANYTGVAMSEGLIHGTTADAAGAVPKGSFWFQPSGEPHVDACESDEPCYLLATFDGAVDMVPADTPSAEPATHMTRGDEIKWVEVKGGVQMAVMHGNPKEGAFQALFQFPAGMTTNVHTHTSGLTGALLSGTHHRGPNADQLVTLSEGAVWSEPASSAHMEKCGPESPCVIVGAMDGALDTEAVELTPAAAE